MATATIAIIGGAILNATAFTGGNVLAKHLMGDEGAEAERERHDKAEENLVKARDAWNKKRSNYQTFIEGQSQKQDIAEEDFYQTDLAFKQKPQLHQFYTPSSPQKKGEIIYIGLGVSILAILIKFI